MNENTGIGGRDTCIIRSRENCQMTIIPEKDGRISFNMDGSWMPMTKRQLLDIIIWLNSWGYLE